MSGLYSKKLSLIQFDKHGSSRSYLIRCYCGNEFESSRGPTNPKVKSCGCHKKDKLYKKLFNEDEAKGLSLSSNSVSNRLHTSHIDNKYLYQVKKYKNKYWLID